MSAYSSLSVGTPSVSGDPSTPIVSESLRVLRASPWTLLDSFEGRPRGFWGRGGGWVAHGGAVLDLRAAQPDRFEAARRWIRTLREVSGEGIRMFGGFAFSESSAAEPQWSPFGQARFQVPEVELRSDGEAFLLVMRASVGGEDAPEDVRRRLRARLTKLERELAGESVGGVPLSASENGEGGSEAGREHWESAVKAALRAIAQGAFRKVVLARSETVVRAQVTDSLTATRRLFAPGSHARVYLFEPEPGVAFLGASPETLARVHDGEAHATAVAGSIRRGSDPDEDRRLARTLRSSEKDLREHAFVVEDIVSRLSGIGGAVRYEEHPRILTLPGIHHLETPISATVPDRVTALDLVERLHPTPAVCGLPQREAFDFLREREGFDRGWYGAPVGWLDSDGNGVTAPALRCALVGPEGAHLFAGAGIVEGSDPAREWEETRLKLETARRAIGRASEEPR